MKVTTKIGWLVAGLLWTTGAYAEDKVSPALRQAVQAVVDQHADAFNRHDPVATMKLFAEDATGIDLLRGDLMDKKSIEKAVVTEQACKDGLFCAATWKGTIVEIRPLGADAAFVDLEVELTGLRDAQRQAEASKSHLLWVLRKTGGKWLISDMRPLFLRVRKPSPPPAPALR
jgi:uncharacterized protein (TIGR02246 family)